MLVQKKDNVAWAQVAAEDRRDQIVFRLFLPRASALCSNSEDGKVSPRRATVNIAGFSAHTLSVTSQLCHCSRKGATGNT